MAIPRREATAILNSLAAGVTPRAGLRHIAVGRLKEVNALKQDRTSLRRRSLYSFYYWSLWLREKFLAATDPLLRTG